MNVCRIPGKKLSKQYFRYLFIFLVNSIIVVYDCDVSQFMEIAKKDSIIILQQVRILQYLIHLNFLKYALSFVQFQFSITIEKEANILIHIFLHIFIKSTKVDYTVETM